MAFRVLTGLSFRLSDVSLGASRFSFDFSTTWGRQDENGQGQNNNDHVARGRFFRSLRFVVFLPSLSGVL